MLLNELKQRAASGQPIRIAASGAGWMGSGFAAQMAHVPGMELSVLIDPDLAAARAAFTATGLDAADVVEAVTVGQAMDAIRQGKRVVTADVELAAQLDARRHDRRHPVACFGRGHCLRRHHPRQRRSAHQHRS
ncbi:MAG: hypothetical protein IPH82_22625 [Chloroflexi bacterium]|nr:hypothetical protein [Chloroflexota bacterium]